MAKTTRARYTLEFKQEAVRLVEGGQSIAAAARTLARVASATREAWATGNPQEVLINAVPDKQAFGHMGLAWLWLDVAHRSLECACAAPRPQTVDRLGACAYFFNCKLPKIGAWLSVVERRDPTCVALPEDAF